MAGRDIPVRQAIELARTHYAPLWLDVGSCGCDERVRGLL